MDPPSRRRIVLAAASVVVIAAVVGFAEIPIGDAAPSPSIRTALASPQPSFDIPVPPTPVASNPFGPSASPSAGPSGSSSASPTPIPPPLFTTFQDSARAGYAVAGAAYTEVAGEWIQPAPVCTPKQLRSVAAWVGLSGRASRSLEQIGTQVDCLGGSVANHYAWFQVYPGSAVRLSILIRPGDRVVATVSRSGPSFTFSISNASLGVAVSVTRPGVEAVDTAGWIVEARRFDCTTACAAPPLAPFGTISFGGLRATGSGQSGALGRAGWTTERIAMVGGNGTVKASPTAALQGGSAFAVVWSHT